MCNYWKNHMDKARKLISWTGIIVGGILGEN